MTQQRPRIRHAPLLTSFFFSFYWMKAVAKQWHAWERAYPSK